MKKFTLILSFLVAMLSTAMASVITPATTLPSDGTPEAYYTMMNGNNVYANGNTAPTNNVANYGNFAFYAVPEVENAYYIYSMTEDKWLTYDVAAEYANGRSVVKLSDVQERYFEVTPCISFPDYYQLRLYTTDGTTVDADKYLNWNGGVDFNPFDGNETLGLWEQNGSDDAGSRYLFTNVSVVFDEVETEPLTSDYYYQIVNKQTKMALACIEGTSAGVAEENVTDATQLWALVDVGEGQYKLLNKSSDTFLEYTSAGGTCWVMNSVGSALYVGIQKKATNEPTPAYYYISGVAIGDAAVANRTCAHDANWGEAYGYKQIVTWDNTADASMWEFKVTNEKVVLNGTAIENVEKRNDKEEIFDLSGHRVNEITVNGIYIVNGKKVIK